MQSKLRKRKFTLHEMMISTTLAVMLLTGLMGVFMYAYRYWRDGVSVWLLNQQTQIARERVLRGLGKGFYGLREAGVRSMVVVPGEGTVLTPEGQVPALDGIDFGVDPNTTPTPAQDLDDVTCSIRPTPDQGLCAQVTGESDGLSPLLGSGINTDEFEVIKSGRNVDIRMRLSVEWGNKRHTRTSLTRAYVSND